jgi:hypothetical protein
VAEFAAFTPVVKEILWLRKLLTSLGTDQQHPTPIYSDSDNAIDILKHPGYESSVKWIDTRYFFVRDEMEKGTVEFVWIDNTWQMASPNLLNTSNSNVFVNILSILSLQVLFFQPPYRCLERR